MKNETNQAFAGVVIDDDQVISFVELCTYCNVSTAQLNDMIEHGIVEPVQNADVDLAEMFLSSSLLRVRTALRLQNDLDVNLAGAVLALDLLDEIKELRQAVKFLQR